MLGKGEGLEAVELFTETARRVRPDFVLDMDYLATVAHICRAVGGLPLAIELAAAWLRSLPLEAVLHEVEGGGALLDHRRHASERHRSLRAVFDHSWALLSKSEQGVMARLAVFRGGARFSAAKEVAGASVADITTLVDKSLLRLSEGRYERHPLVQQYSLEKLSEDEDSLVQTRNVHQNYFFSFVKNRFSERSKSFTSADADYLTEELANLRAAWGWAVARRDWAGLYRVLEPLLHFFLTRSFMYEASERYDEALGALEADPSADAKKLAAALQVHKSLALWFFGRYQDVEHSADKALDECRALGLDAEAALALDTLGVVAMWFESLQEAEDYFQQSLGLFKRLGDRHGQANYLHNMGMLRRQQGDYEAARGFYEPCLALCRELDNRMMTAAVLNSLGSLAYAQEKLGEAERYHREALGLHREVKDPHGLIAALTNTGIVVLDQGEFEEAERLLEEALALARQIGSRRWQVNATVHLGRVASAHEHDLGKALARFKAALKIVNEMGGVPILALGVLLYLAEALLASGLDGAEQRAVTYLELILRHESSKEVYRRLAKDLLAKVKENRSETTIGLEAAVASALAYPYSDALVAAPSR